MDHSMGGDNAPSGDGDAPPQPSDLPSDE